MLCTIPKSSDVDPPDFDADPDPIDLVLKDGFLIRIWMRMQIQTISFHSKVYLHNHCVFFRLSLLLGSNRTHKIFSLHQQDSLLRLHSGLAVIFFWM